MRRRSQTDRCVVAAGLLLGCAAVAWAAEEPPASTARTAYEAALAESAATAKPRTWLGVFLNDAMDGGVEVMGLAPGGPAQRAGLRVGDLILEVDGKPAPNQAALDRLVELSAPGDALELGLLRGGESLVLQVELGERATWFVPVPRPAPARAERPARPAAPVRDRLQLRAARSLYGLQVAEMTPALREHFGAPPDAGVLVLGVDSAETAATIGFQVGDVLVQLGGRGISDEDQLRWTLSSWTTVRPLTASVIRGGEPVVVEFRPEAAPAAPAAPAVPAPSPEAERELLERRLQLEIQRLEERIRELREELELLRHRR